MRLTILLTLLLIATTVSAQQENTSVALIVSKQCASELFTSSKCAAELRTAISFAVDHKQPDDAQPLADLADDLKDLHQTGTLDDATLKLWYAQMDAIVLLDARHYPTAPIVVEKTIHDQCGDGNRRMLPDSHSEIRKHIVEMRDKFLPKIEDEAEHARIAARLKALEELYAK